MPRPAAGPGPAAGPERGFYIILSPDGIHNRGGPVNVHSEFVLLTEQLLTASFGEVLFAFPAVVETFVKTLHER